MAGRSAVRDEGVPACGRGGWLVTRAIPVRPPGASPPDGAGPAGAGGVLMSANNGGIDKVQVPVDLTTGIGLDLQSRQNVLPQAGLAPAIEPTGDGADRAIALGQIPPRRAGAQNP